MDTETPAGRSNFSRRVAAEIRAEKGRQQVSNSALARLLGVSEMWVSRKLRGVNPLTLDDVERFAEVLEVPTGVLLNAAVHRSPDGEANRLAYPGSVGRTSGLRSERAVLAASHPNPPVEVEPANRANRASHRRPVLQLHACAGAAR